MPGAPIKPRAFVWIYDICWDGIEGTWDDWPSDEDIERFEDFIWMVEWEDLP